MQLVRLQPTYVPVLRAHPGLHPFLAPAIFWVQPAKKSQNFWRLKNVNFTWDCQVSLHGLQKFNFFIICQTVAATSAEYGSPRSITESGKECAENNITAL